MEAMSRPITDYSGYKDATMVVLGQRMESDGVSLIVPDTLVARAQTAYFVYWAIRAAISVSIPIIVSGGDPAELGLSEGRIMSGLLTGQLPKTWTVGGKIFPIKQNLEVDLSAHGPLEADSIIVEDKSTSTEENALYSRKLTDSNTWFLVSSEFHLPRAKWLFDLILNHVDGPEITFLDAPFVVPDPEIPVSHVAEKIGQTFDPVKIFPGWHRWQDTNIFNNLERVAWDRAIFRTQVDHYIKRRVAINEHSVKKALREYEGVLRVYEKRWPLQKYTVVNKNEKLTLPY